MRLPLSSTIIPTWNTSTIQNIASQYSNWDLIRSWFIYHFGGMILDPSWFSVERGNQFILRKTTSLNSGEFASRWIHNFLRRRTSIIAKMVLKRHMELSILIKKLIYILSLNPSWIAMQQFIVHMVIPCTQLKVSAQIRLFSGIPYYHAAFFSSRTCSNAWAISRSQLFTLIHLLDPSFLPHKDLWGWRWTTLVDHCTIF